LFSLFLAVVGIRVAHVVILSLGVLAEAAAALEVTLMLCKLVILFMNVIDLDLITGTALVDSNKLEMLLTLDVAVSTQQPVISRFVCWMHITHASLKQKSCILLYVIHPVLRLIIIYA